jgi:phosphoglycolate phosphatase-like HAD superfamily hydrolase
MRLLLFDIDGTLIDSGGAGSRALEHAFESVLGIRGAVMGVDGVSLAGKTDPQIIREVLTINERPYTERLREALTEAYLERLDSEIANNQKRMMPGVHELLETLAGMGAGPMGLLTGNVEAGARKKLAPFGLNQYFAVGAYGSDHEDRNQLLPAAIARYEAAFGRAVAPAECVVIGDTPRDVECAHAHGARALGVATGPYSVQELKDAGADFTVADLADPAALHYLMKQA